MIIYTILVIFLLIFSICESYYVFSRKVNTILFFFFSVCIFLIYALRTSSVGADTWMYCETFDLYLTNGWDFSNIRFEIGYSFFVKLLTFISHDSQVLLVFSSIIIVGSVSTFCYRFSPKPLLSLLLFVLLGNFMSYMNILREALAISIVLMGFSFATKRGIKNIIVFELFVSLATTFHTSAIIATIIPFFKYIRITKYTLIIEAFVCILLFVFAEQIFSLLTTLLNKYSGYSTSKFAESNYFGALIGAIVGTVLVGTYVYASRKELYSLQYSLQKRSTFAENIDTESFYEAKPIVSVETSQLIMLGVVYIFTLFLTMKMNIFNRLSNMYAIYNVLIIPYAFSKMKTKNEILYKMALVFVLLVYFYIIIIFRPEWNGCIPYQSIIG